MRFHFDFAHWFQLIRLAWREPKRTSRNRLLRMLLLRVPAVAAFHAVCFALDPLLFPSLRRTRVRTPVFIVGHARSGTTLLHRLMSEDRERFSAFLLYELWLPSLLQKKAVRAVARLDARFLGGALERRVRAWEERRLGPTRHVHEQSLTEPEEDDGVLMASCASGNWMVRLPWMGEVDFFYVDRWPERRRRRLMRFYAECVRRQVCANGERIHLSKNPVFAGRVESLIETFPDARIVVPFRNPYETIPSLLKLMKIAWKMRGWAEADMQRSLRYLAEQSYDTYRQPLEVLARHPEVPHAIVDYAELVAEPKKVIERVYAELGFPVTPAYAQVLDARQQKARRHASGHRYSLEEFGLDGAEIRRRLADLFERFHWDDAAAPPATPGADARGGAAPEDEHGRR